MIETDYMWLSQRERYLYVSTRMTTEETQTMYDIYNRLTGESKKPNGCGACLRGTVNTVRHHYELYKKNL